MRYMSWLAGLGVTLISSLCWAQAHPNLYFNTAELNEYRARVQAKEEPIRTHFAQLIASARSLNTTNVYEGTNTDEFRRVITAQPERALAAAMMPYLVPNVAEAEAASLQKRARDFLVLWASRSLPSPNIGDYCRAGECLQEESGLSIGIQIPAYVAAYDLLYDSGALSASDHRVIQDWLSKTYRILRDNTYLWSQRQVVQVFSNHSTAHIAAMASIAYILEQPGQLAESIDGTKLGCCSPLPYSWKSLVRDAIYLAGQPRLGADLKTPSPTATGEVFDGNRHFDPGALNACNANPATANNSRRGYGYSLLTLGNLAMVAEMSLHRGEDLYAYTAPSGESLLLPARFQGKVKLDNGPGDKIICANDPGSQRYRGELLRDVYNPILELVNVRYPGQAEIEPALGAYDAQQTLRRWFWPIFFGKTARVGSLKAPSAPAPPMAGTGGRVQIVQTPHDLLPAFSASYYLSIHPDLVRAFGPTNYAAARSHWDRHGRAEGRASSPAFAVKEYMSFHADLRNAFGPQNWPAAIDHYLRHGTVECRRSAKDFDPRSYLNRYADLQRAFGSDCVSAAGHFVRAGYNEGRVGN